MSDRKGREEKMGRKEVRMGREGIAGVIVAVKQRCRITYTRSLALSNTLIHTHTHKHTHTNTHTKLHTCTLALRNLVILECSQGKSLLHGT